MSFVCPVCDNTAYDENDGLYYCTVCLTQSKEMMRQEANDETIQDQPTLTPQSFKYLIKTKVDGPGQRKRNDFGRPWTLYEAYQFIILAQADAFISLLGEPEILKEHIFSVWASYLSALRVAFCSEEKVVPDVVVQYGCGRQRELHRGSLSNPVNRNKRPFVENETPKSKKRKKLSHDQDTDDNACESVSCEETSCSKEDEKIRLYACDKDNILFVDERKQTRAAYQKARNTAEWMDMKKTITIAFLGLQCTNPYIIPADVVRWVYEGKIPFLSVTHLLPPDMVMSGTDHGLFGPSSLETEQFILEVNKLKSFLGLKSLPEASKPVLIKRFLKDLELPDKLFPVCVKLTDLAKCSTTFDPSKYRRPELPALLSIGLAVRLLFGLDGVTESKLSFYSTRVRDALNSDTNIFVFAEWKAHQIRKCSLKYDAVSDVNGDLTPALSTQDPDKLLECYNNFMREERRFGWQEDYIAEWLSEESREMFPLESVGTLDLYMIEYLAFRDSSICVYKIVSGVPCCKSCSALFCVAGGGKKCKQEKYRSSLRDPLVQAMGRQMVELSRTNTGTETEIEVAGKRFRDGNLSHITDFASFKKDHGDKLSEEDVHNLEMDLKTITDSISYFEFDEAKDRKALQGSRPKTYLWFLEQLAKIADCPVVTLDTGLRKMHAKLKIRLRQE